MILQKNKRVLSSTSIYIEQCCWLLIKLQNDRSDYVYYLLYIQPVSNIWYKG